MKNGTVTTKNVYKLYKQAEKVCDFVRVRSGQSLAFTCRGRFGCFACRRRLPRRWEAIESGGAVKPDLRELQVGRANFLGSRLARPFKTLLRHRSILGGRFHTSRPPAVFAIAAILFY